MFVLLIAIATLLVSHDIWLTRRRLLKYGVAAELNPITHWFCKELGITAGVVTWLTAGHLWLTLLAFKQDWLTFYAFYTGWLGNHYVQQRLSLILEKQLDELRPH